MAATDSTRFQCAVESCLEEPSSPPFAGIKQRQPANDRTKHCTTCQRGGMLTANAFFVMPSPSALTILS